ncbi:GA-binding protein subunit beta-2-like protein [Balamuthia mandrillaris]
MQPPEQLPPLLAAAVAGDVQEITRLVQSFQQPNHEATTTNPSRSFKKTLSTTTTASPQLLRFLNTTDSIQETALYKAVTHDHPSVVSLLLKLGADASMANDLGYTPLHEAAQYGHSECAALLLSAKGAAGVLQRRNHNGMTPMQLAARYHHKKTVRVLSKGASHR